MDPVWNSRLFGTRSGGLQGIQQVGGLVSVSVQMLTTTLANMRIGGPWES